MTLQLHVVNPTLQIRSRWVADSEFHFVSKLIAILGEKALRGLNTVQFMQVSN